MQKWESQKWNVKKWNKRGAKEEQRSAEEPFRFRISGVKRRDRLFSFFPRQITGFGVGIQSEQSGQKQQDAADPAERANLQKKIKGKTQERGSQKNLIKFFEHQSIPPCDTLTCQSLYHSKIRKAMSFFLPRSVL